MSLWTKWVRFMTKVERQLGSAPVLRQRWRPGHLDPVADDMFRLIRLDDDPWMTYIGTRSWCNAVKRRCEVCGRDGCCDCTHSERNPNA